MSDPAGYSRAHDIVVAVCNTRAMAEQALVFVKGQSGNPAGRKKTDGPTVSAVVKMMRDNSEAAAQRLIDYALGNLECKPDVSVRAAEIVLDRAWGKPKQDSSGSKVTGFVAMLPAPLPADQWLATFSPHKTIEHESVALPQPANDTSAEGSSAADDCKD